MTSDTIALVRESWKKVEAIAPEAAALFYQNLFAADFTPRVRQAWTELYAIAAGVMATAAYQRTS